MPSIQFKGKSVIETYHHTVAHHKLEFDPKLSVFPKGEKGGPSLEGNLIIEGDNLLALKALLPTHAGKIKCVYIDPPYNTGNEGWVYNDNLTQPQFKEWIGQTVGKEGEDATRHDKWCCMMWPRLTLLRELMREDGSIWVSIDDNEVQNLRAIMDEVFGAENFVATIVWQKRTSPDMRLAISDAHEYIVIYAKSANHVTFNKIPKTPDQIAQFKNPDNDPRGPWVSSDYTAQGFRPNQMYKIRTPGGAEYEPPPGVCWKNVEPVYKELAKDGRIWFGKDGNAMPRRKTFLSESAGDSPWTWWGNDEAGHTQEAKQEVADIFGSDEAFPTPKPTQLIERIAIIATNAGDVVLDSFAGSGTTGHSLLALSHQNKSARSFILVQQPFDTKQDEVAKLNIAKDVTRARIAAAINGYGKAQHKVDGLGGSFSYIRVGEPLFTEYRDLGKKLPSFEDLAKYIFYTETSREIDLKKVNAETGFIGSLGPTAFYLLYTPNNKEDRELSTVTLKEILKREKAKSLVIYCEKIWMHPEELRRAEREHNVKLRTMLVPFNLK